ncbi:MAG: YitT family protein [Paludibacteraceae bacterium]|nr:YitT family protein [Paludibacteraceae bacterium]
MNNKLASFIEPAKHLNWWLSWVNIFLGCTILAAGFVFFINPYNIVPGGVYGASIVLHNIFPSIQVGIFGYMFDVPLLILSVLLLGTAMGARTVVAVLTTPTIMNAMERAVYPTEEALKALDPTQILGGRLDLSDHLLLTSIMGAVVIGIGTGLVIRNQATTGGSDIVGMIFQKYLHIPFSNAILIVDATVVTFGLVVIGFGLGGSNAGVSDQSPFLLSFYSLISIFIISRVIAYVISGSKDDKILFIITDKKNSALQDFIIKEIGRSATRIKSSGLYSDIEKEMLFMVLNRKEAAAMKVKLKEVDPNAFVVVTDAYEAFGQGWQSLPEKGDINPE